MINHHLYRNNHDIIYYVSHIPFLTLEMGVVFFYTAQANMYASVSWVLELQVYVTMSSIYSF